MTSHKRKSKQSRKPSKSWYRPVFATPESLLSAAIDYMQWVADTPMIEPRLVSNQGEHELMELPKMRAASQSGFCLHAKLAVRTYQDYKTLDQFRDVCSTIDEMIRTQKFEGGAAGLLNAVIISRDLGLTEKTSSEISGPDGEPVSVFNFIPVGPDDS